MIKDNRGPGYREAHSNHNPLKSSGIIRFSGPAKKLDHKITYFVHTSNNRKVSYDIKGLQTPTGLEIYTEFVTGRPEFIVYSIAGTELRMPALEYIAKQLVSCVKRREADIEAKPEEEAILNPYKLDYLPFEEFRQIIKNDKETLSEILKYEPSLKEKL